MNNVVLQFPNRLSLNVSDKKKEFDIFSDLSELIGIDLKKVIIDENKEEINKMQKKLQKDSMIIRSNFINERT
jgi:hypothetical protein